MTPGLSTLTLPASAGRFRRPALVLGVVVLLVALLGAATPARAADQINQRRGESRLCDPTACYVAWGVLDSDHDGVSDADELMAGTDPYDPKSRPLLRPIAELGMARQLPSFEAGLGTFVLFPPEILAMREKIGIDPLGAFAMPARQDALTRMGISSGLLEQYGLSADRDGFTIGLDTPATKDNVPGPRVAGIDARLISAGTSQPVSNVAHGGVKEFRSNKDGTYSVTDFNDGTRAETKTDPADGTVTVNRTNRDGSAGTTSTIQRRDGVDGDVKIHTEKETVTGADDTLLSVTTTESHTLSDGATSTLSVTTEYVRDNDGNVTGTVVTTTVSYASADGSYGSGAKTTESCDAGGGNCTEVSSEYQDSDGVDYSDPDATDPAIVTQESVDNVLRIRGAAVTVMAGWTAPGLENEPKDPRNPGAVMLTDSNLAEQFLLIEPTRVTKAQPEARPDLPNPRQAAPAPAGGGCTGLC